MRKKNEGRMNVLTIYIIIHYYTILSDDNINDPATYTSLVVPVLDKFSCVTLILKAFALFCCEFGNDVNHPFFGAIFWAKNAIGATFFTFCNYGYDFWHHQHLLAT